MSTLRSCLFWPLLVVWRLVSTIFELTGRLLACSLGLALMILGIVVSLTVIGAIIGIPMVLFGLLLIVRGLF